MSARITRRLFPRVARATTRSTAAAQHQKRAMATMPSGSGTGRSFATATATAVNVPSEEKMKEEIPSTFPTRSSRWLQRFYAAQKQLAESASTHASQMPTRPLAQQVAPSRFNHSKYWWRRRKNRWPRTLATLHSLKRTSAGNDIHVYYDTGDAFRSMWDAVDNAKKTIRWQTYICKDDNVGQITMKKLEAAQRRGVTVELLYDTGGNITGRAGLVESLKGSGATVIAHRSFFSYFCEYFKRGMKWELSPAIRNHRKILIVDDTVAFAGGLNIGDDYCSKEAGGNGRFRDTMCKVTGPAVAHLNEVYEDTKSPAVRNMVKMRRWRHWMAAAVREYNNGGEAALAGNTKGKDESQQHHHLHHHARNEHSHHVDRRVRVTARFLRQLRKGDANSISSWQRFKTWSSEWRTRQRTRLAEARTKASKRSSAVFVTPTASSEVTATAASTTSSAASEIRRARLKARAERLIMRARLQAANNHRKLQYLMQRAAAMSPRGSAPQTGSDGKLTEPRPHALQMPATTQVLACNPHARDWGIQKAFWVVVSNSQERVWVTTPYYAPHRKLVKALTNAAKRGVDVRILAGSNNTTDPFWMWYASQYLSRTLLKSGVKIYEFHGGQILHAKTVAVDSSWASVGSYNWDVMSNKLLEVCVTENSRPFVSQVEAHFEQDMSKAKPLTIEDSWDNHSYWLRFRCWAAYQFMMKIERFTFWTYKDPDLTSRLD